jgi:outer membrane immunogenic protein
MNRRAVSFAATALLFISVESSMATATRAQTPIDTTLGTAPLEVTLAYSADRTNGVVGGCGCFWLSGGKAEASAIFPYGISLVAELTGQHAGNINAKLDSLSYVTYLFGPRYTFRNRSRLIPFAQFLVGGVHGFDALFPGTGASVADPDAFAFAAGGGLKANLSRRLGLRVLQGDYLQTQLPNDGNNRQNHLRLSGGVVFRFGEDER